MDTLFSPQRLFLQKIIARSARNTKFRCKMCELDQRKAIKSAFIFVFMRRHDADHQTLLLHMEVRWSSRGRVCTETCL